MIEDLKRRSFLKKAALTLPVLPQLGNKNDDRNQDRKSRTYTDYKIKLSLNLYSFNSMLTNGEITLDEVIDFCALIGFDAIDPTAYYFPDYPQVPNDQFINEFKLKTFKKGLDISGTGVRNDFTSNDPEKISSDLNLIESWARASSKLGAPLLRIFAGTSYQGSRDRAEVTEQVIGHFKTCAKIGEKYGVVMAFQNHDDFVHNSDQIIEFCITHRTPTRYWHNSKHKLDYPSIHDSILESGSMTILPIIIENGIQYHNILSPNPDSFRKLLTFLQERFTDVNIRALSSKPTETLQDFLTDKQYEALMLAYRKGYYEIPKKITLEEIGEELGIKRIACQERIRRAEKRIIDYFVKDSLFGDYRFL